MSVSPVSVVGGMLLGLASSVHCIGMCGGISCALSGFSPQGGAAAAIRAGALPQVGRILAYMLLGAIAGGVGAGAANSLDAGTAHAALRWAGALALGCIGLSTAGWLPGLPAVLSRIRLPYPRQGEFLLRPVVAGCGWGLMPCTMVYGALLFAAFTGTITGGALVMAGFGLGTVPALLLASFGYVSARSWARKRNLRMTAGVAIAALGPLSLIAGNPAFAALCGWRGH